MLRSQLCRAALTHLQEEKLHAKGPLDVHCSLNSSKPGLFPASQLLSASQEQRHPKASKCASTAPFPHPAPSRHPQIFALYKLGGFPISPALITALTAAEQLKQPKKQSKYPQKGTTKELSHQPRLQRQPNESLWPITLQGSVFLCGFPLSLPAAKGSTSCTARNTSHLVRAFQITAGFSPGAGASLPSLTAPMQGCILHPPGATQL